MTPHAPHSIVAPLRRLIAEERRRRTTDCDLLQAFAERGDADAFTELLRRHGPMVLHLALHLLHHRQDAEDVFQDVFLALTRKARSLRNASSIAGWLHRVTWRLAARRRAASSRRHLYFQPSPLPEQRDPVAEIGLNESQVLLHQELAGLPDRLRLPLVLCYLQGQTRDEAASRLGWSLGTLKRRLERGRKLLHARLSRRGLTLPAVLSTVLLGSVDVSASLAKGTLRLAMSLSARSSPALSVSALLAKACASAKLKAAWVVVLALAATGAGSWVSYHQLGDSATQPESSPSDHIPVAAKAEDVAHPACDRFGDPLPAGASARLGTVRLRHADYLYALAFAPDGKTVVATGSDGVRVWDAASGRQLRHFGAGVLPRSVALSPDGRRIALSRYHAGIGAPVDVWDVASGKLLYKVGNRHYSLVRFSPDGKRLAALAGENTPRSSDIAWNIDIWDAETGRDIRTLSGPKEYVSDMAFSADGKTLLLGGSGKSISLRSVADGKEERRIRDLPGDVHSLVLSPRGDRVAFIESWVKEHAQGSISYGTGTRVFLVDLRSGAELRRWTVPPETDPNGVLKNGWWHMAFSPDGRKLVVCQQNGPVRVWDTATGKETSLLADGRMHSGGAIFSPDGKTLAVGDGGRVLRLIDADTGADRVMTKGHRGSVTAVAVSADGRTVFTATDEGMIHRWDARTGRELGRSTGHKREVTGLALSADGRTLCSVSLDQSLRVWDLDSGKQRRLLHDGNVSWVRLTLSPDGKTLAVPVNSKELLLFNPASGERLRRLTTKTQIITVAFAADAPVVMALTGDRTIWRWEMPTGRRLPDLSLPPDRDDPPIDNPDSSYGGEKIVLSPDGRYLAHANDDRFLRVVDVAMQREMYRTAKLPGKVSAITFAPDSRTLAWSEESGVLHWLELASWSERLRLPGHAGAVKQMIFTADSKQLISASEDTTALVWNLLGRGAKTLTAEKLSVCWTDLASADAGRAYRAMRRLMAAPSDALAHLRPRLKVVEDVDERRIEQRIADLDADAFAVRDKATQELQKLGELAEPALRKALASRPTLEMSRRLRALLDESGSHQWRPSAEELRQLRAVEVLEHIGTAEARILLGSLVRGAAGARLTREVRAALHRLRR